MLEAGGTGVVTGPVHLEFCREEFKGKIDGLVVICQCYIFLLSNTCDIFLLSISLLKVDLGNTTPSVE